MIAPTTYDYGAGPVAVWYHFRLEWTPAPGRWPLIVTLCATGPVSAARRARRSFPPEPGTRLARMDWNPCAPCIRPTDPDTGRPVG